MIKASVSSTAQAQLYNFIAMPSHWMTNRQAMPAAQVPPLPFGAIALAADALQGPLGRNYLGAPSAASIVLQASASGP